MKEEPANVPALPVVALAALLSAFPAAAQTLAPGTPVDGHLAAADTMRYAVPMGDDYFVHGELDQGAVDMVVRFVGPEGEGLSRYDARTSGLEQFARPFSDGGDYTLEVFATDAEAEGDFTLVLHRLEPLETDPVRLTDQLMARFTGDDTAGAAVQVWRDGRTLYSKAYGMANLAYGIPFRTDTRTNIGSTSKQFTAFAVMLQAERGLLSLDDDIRKHVPELPEFDGTITVRHLLTHTSGLREFLNLLVMSGRRLDRGDWIDRAELIDVVQRQPALQNAPGAEWNYNNTAFGLAALIVERTSGQEFHVFMEENVSRPIGMTRTMVRPSPHHVVPDMSEGYVPADGGYLQLGDLGGAVGAGGIYSTVEDLQRWAENYREPRVGTPETFEQMMTSYVLSSGEETGYGFGLGVGTHRGLRRVAHNGADVAHRSNFLYYPELGAGLTVQSNHAEFNSGIAGRIAEAFFADAMTPEGASEPDAAEGFDPAAYDPEDFDDFVGRYALDAAPDFVLTFTRDGDDLYTQATGQPRLAIAPTSDSTFALVDVDASVVFHRSEDGRVEGLTLRQNGEQHATRLEDGDALVAWEPDAEALEDFVGRYFSEELETFYDIALEDGALVVRHRRLDDAALSPGSDEDAFSGGGLSFLFERDRNGTVIGFYVDNVRTRDVRFGRVR